MRFGGVQRHNCEHSQEESKKTVSSFPVIQDELESGIVVVHQQFSAFVIVHRGPPSSLENCLRFVFARRQSKRKLQRREGSTQPQSVNLDTEGRPQKLKFSNTEKRKCIGFFPSRWEPTNLPI